jgi:hypothetical protein
MKNITVEPLFKTIKTKKLESRASFIQLKPVLDILLRSFSLSTCPQHSLKVLLLLNSMSFKLLVCIYFSNFDPDYATSGLTVTELARDYCTKIS